MSRTNDPAKIAFNEYYSLIANQENAPNIEEFMIVANEVVAIAREDGIRKYEENLPKGTKLTDTQAFGAGNREVERVIGDVHSFADAYNYACEKLTREKEQANEALENASLEEIVNNCSVVEQAIADIDNTHTSKPNHGSTLGLSHKETGQETERTEELSV